MPETIDTPVSIDYITVIHNKKMKDGLNQQFNLGGRISCNCRYPNGLFQANYVSPFRAAEKLIIPHDI